MREHAIELALGAHAEAALTPEIIEGHRVAMRAGLGVEYLASCEARGAAWADCMMRAHDERAIAACGSVR